MTKNSYRGYEIKFINNKWIYSDTKEKVSSNINIICGHCVIKNRRDGHDACIGELKNIMNACCGHGKINGCYVQFMNGLSIRGIVAKIIIKILKIFNVLEFMQERTK